jgi:hypothetical protein
MSRFSLFPEKFRETALNIFSKLLECLGVLIFCFGRLCFHRLGIGRHAGLVHWKATRRLSSIARKVRGLLMIGLPWILTLWRGHMLWHTAHWWGYPTGCRAAHPLLFTLLSVLSDALNEHLLIS